MKENRPSKRQRREDPPSWLQNNSLACVASPGLGDPIRTPVASVPNKELFFSRLQKEIIEQLKWDRQGDKKAAKSSAREDSKRDWKKRIVLGTNQCTRALEKALAGKCRPSLIVLARDIYPPTMLSHVPVMAKQIKQSDGTSLPILLLPGKASMELGGIFGARRVSVIVFLEGETEDPSLVEEEKSQHAIITSFVHFVKESLFE